jgi:hypothetical protein
LAEGWRGEPVLYYWMERGSAKAFYHCQDLGRITSAWAELALAAGARAHLPADEPAPGEEALRRARR